MKVKTAPPFSGPPTSQEQTPATAPELKQLFREAVQAHQRGEIDTAIEKYQDFLALKPNFVHGWSNLGAALSRAGRYGEAVPNYEKALELDPGNTAVRLNLALAYYKQMKLSPAVDELMRVNVEQPDNQQAIYLLADSYMRLGENKRVIALLEPLDAKSTDDRTVAYLLGTALLRDGQTGKGQILINRFMRYGDTAEIHILIGASQLAAMDYEVALTTLKKAVELNPKLPGVWSLYGRAELENDHPEEAKSAFRKQLEADPADFDANLHLGALLRMEKKLNEALPFVEAALRVRPKSISARYQVASVHLGLGDAEQAIRELESVVKEAPEFLEAHVQLASAYYKAGRTEDGQRERDLIMKLNVENRKRERQREAVKP